MVKIGNVEAYELADLCEKFGVKPDTMRRYMLRGQMKFRKIGKKRFVTERSLREFLEARKS